MSPAHGNEPTSLWRVLAHPTRRQIVRLLQEKPRTTGELCRFFDVSRYAVMKHLRVLEEVGLIAVRREGRKRWNMLDEERIEAVSERLRAEAEEWQPGENGNRPETAAIYDAGVLHLRHEVLLDAAPQRVFAALTAEIDRWWQPRLADDSCLVLEPHINGRFYETFDDGAGAALHGTVNYVRPPEEIRFTGRLGLVDEAAISAVRLALYAAGEQTQLTLTHHVAGEVDEAMQEALQEQWRELLEEHLAGYLAH